jgi:transposase InsO family protein
MCLPTPVSVDFPPVASYTSSFSGDTINKDHFLPPLMAWSAVPALGVPQISPAGRVPIFSATGSPLCAFVAGGSSLTFVDSGATYHMTGDSSLFTDMRPVDTPVAGIDSASSLRASGFGNICVLLGGQAVTLTGVFYVPGVAHTLVSVRALVRPPGASCTFTAGGVRLDLPGMRRPVWAPSSSGLFTLDNFTSLSPAANEVPLGYYVDSRRRRPQKNTYRGKLSLATLLHRRCGHLSWGNQHLSAAMKAEYGAKFDPSSAIFCSDCVMAKMHQFHSGLPSVRKATRPLGRVHFDIVFGIPTMGIGNNKGFLLIVDEFTDKVFIYFLRSKSEVPAKLKEFKNMAEKHFQQSLGCYLVPPTLSCFRSDNAAEQTSAEVREWLKAEGIQHELSAPYCQWQDGKAERFIRTVWEGSEAMRKAAGAPPRYWPFSLRAFVHAQDLLPRRDKVSPWEAWNSVSVSLDARIRHLRVWGTRCFFLIPKALRKKLDDKARECLFVGYSSTSKAYVGVEFSTGKILMSPNVFFDETCYPCKDSAIALPMVRAGGNIGSNMTELSWVPVPRTVVEPPKIDALVPPAPISISSLSSDDEEEDEVSAVSAPTSPVLSGGEDSDSSDGLDGIGPSSLDRLTVPPVAKDSDPADSAEVMALFARVSKAQSNHISCFGNPLEYVDMDGCPVIPESTSHGMVLGRLAVSLQRPSISKPTLLRYRHRFDVLSGAYHRIRLVAMAAAPRLIPRHLGDVYRDRNCESWKVAMRAELSNFDKMKVWELVDRPQGRNVMSCKWVFDVKYDPEGAFEKYKARLTCRGFTQVKGQDYEETWAPTCRLRVLRSLLALASTNRAFKTAQWDVTAAFLQSDADCEMYMEQPPGFNEGGADRGKVYKLLKSVYGTKQASRLFFQLVRKTLLELGAVQAKADECLFILKSKVGEVYVLTHVDDFGVFYTDPALYARIFARMREVFIGGFKDLGPLHKFLGIIIERRPEGGFRVHQAPKIKALLERLGLGDVAYEKSPAKAGTKHKLHPLLEPLSEEDALFMAAVPYKEAVGALFYICRASRWDISHACSQVARFMANPGPKHWDAVRRIYGYLRRTADVGLVIAADSLLLDYTNADETQSPRAMRLEGWADADWAGTPSTRKSHTGWLVRCGGSLVSWLSKGQGCISQSTMEAELVAVTALSNEVLWWRILWEDLDIPLRQPVPLWSDSSSAVSLADHAGKFDATKHIELKHLVIREHQQYNLVKVGWVAGRDQLADVLTKALHPADFIAAVTAVMGESVS